MVDMDENTVLLVALVILLVPFPLTSVGTTEGIAWLWWLGIAMLALGGVIPPVTRYVGDEEDDENDGDEGGENGDTTDGSSERAADGGTGTGEAGAEADTRSSSQRGTDRSVSGLCTPIPGRDAPGEAVAN